jgi:CBS domain-containing protein
MKDMTVGELMVPLEEYATAATAPENATLYEAIMALEKAQEELDLTKYKFKHRAILIYDKNKKIVGKLSQFDALSAMEPKYSDMGDTKILSRTGFSPNFLKDMVEKHALWDEPPVDLCRKAMNRKVKDVMSTPTEGEYIREDAHMREAVHLLVMGQHHSLLVTRGEEIIGILRLVDVLMFIYQLMKSIHNGD